MGSEMCTRFKDRIRSFPVFSFAHISLLISSDTEHSEVSLGGFADCDQLGSFSQAVATYLYEVKKPSNMFFVIVLATAHRGGYS